MSPTDLIGMSDRVCSGSGLPTAKSFFIDGIAMHRSFFTSDLPFLSFHPPVFNPFLFIPLVAALPFSAVRPWGIGFFSKGNRRFPFLPMPAFCPWVSEKSSSPAVERIFPYRPWRMSTATFQGRKIIPAAANGPKKGK